MSKLDRMNIAGLRSYGKETDEVQGIRFYHPLTVIQGPNGCGKTTIIEAIKFAITGDVPSGSTRGQGFVYDPKLSQDTESIGKVKLRVFDAKGDVVSVFKSVKLSIKASNKVEFKRTDSSITRGQGTNVVQTSSRCADVDQEMCCVLGVSKAIINQVLLCHQEDANWPMEESKKLKERFDEIFDATKYNKCQDHILKKIKEKMEALKVMKAGLVGLQQQKKLIESRKLTLHDKQAKFDLLTENIEEILLELKPLNKRIDELFILERNFSKVYTNIELKKKDLEYLDQQKHETLKHLKVFDGSDAELEEKINKFQNELKLTGDQIAQLRKEKETCDTELKEFAQSISNKQNILGSLQAEISHNEKNTKERNQLILHTSRDLGVRCNEMNLDSDISKHIDLLQKRFKENKAQTVEKQVKMDHEEEQMQIEIDLAREENAQLEQKIKSRKRQLQETKDEMRKIKNKLEELNSADDQLRLSEDKLKRLENDIQSLETSFNSDDVKRQIEETKQKLQESEERYKLVENEIRELQQYTTIQTELDVKNENLLSKSNELKKHMNKHKNTLEKIFNDNIPEINLKNKIETYIQDKRNRIRNLRTVIDSKQKDVLKLDNTLKSSKDKLTDKLDELSENIEKIKVYCEEPESLSEEIEIINNNLKDLNDQRGSLASSEYMYKSFIKKFQKDKPCCPLCKRGVQEKAAIEQIINDLNYQIRNIPNAVDELDRTLSLQQNKHEKLLALQPLTEKNKKLEEEEIPTLRTQIANDQKKYDENVGQLNKYNDELSVLQKQFDTSNGMFGDMCLIDQCQKEITNLRQHIASLEDLMPNKSGFEDKRGIDEAMTERDALVIEIRTRRNSIENNQTRLTQYAERIHMRRDQKNKLLCEQLTIKKNLQDKDHLVTKSIELDDKIVVYTCDIAELETHTEPIKDKLNQYIRNKSEQKTKNQQILNQLRTKLETEQKALTQIVNLDKEIEKFKNADKERTAKDISNKIHLIKCDIEQSTTKKEKINTEIEGLMLKTTNSELYYRELQDNVKLRQTEKKFKTLRHEIEREEANIGKNNITQIRKEKQELNDEYDNIMEQKHRKEGEKTQLSEDIKDLKKELSSPKSVSAAVDYHRKNMETQLLETVILDMKEYSKAMDWALMQHHKKRMVQVNNSIRELWRRIYKGNDIDYIQIETDLLEDKSTTRRRLFSYRVLQVKNDILLDMRGRCSAGQRVLASIVIRMALAETFSHNCGILALDEPTTNLDRANINSLAEALVELIQHKREQDHFQLLIITHDMEFVDKLTQSESLDKYYEIKRNDVGRSIIEEHNVY